jgi:hypothetical protein
MRDGFETYHHVIKVIPVRASLAEEEPEESADDKQASHATDHTADNGADVCWVRDILGWHVRDSLVLLPLDEPAPAVLLLTAEVVTTVEPSELVWVTVLNTSTRSRRDVGGGLTHNRSSMPERLKRLMLQKRSKRTRHWRCSRWQRQKLTR